MSQNIVEFLREESIKNLFATSGFNSSWNTWAPYIRTLAPALTPHQVLGLGDHLKDIFFTTNTSTRSQSDVSGGGSSWEALVCWYLNLCLIGRRTVVIKHSKKLIPDPIADAITVNYRNFVSNTESDLVAITFPNTIEYLSDKDDISILDINNLQVPTTIRKRYNLKGILNALVARDFNQIEIHIIQCKTNWNDNAQIPMLWDMIYSANTFRTDITVGRNGYSINDIQRFTYSFVTVPTVNVAKLLPTSTAIKRVTNISGGNYWGLPSVTNVSSSIKEMLDRNLRTGHASNHLTTIATEIPKINSEYSFFRL
ncbi:MAG: hypothetical protein AB7V48_17765 [Sedimentibacter sp.]